MDYEESLIKIMGENFEVPKIDDNTQSSDQILATFENFGQLEAINLEDVLGFETDSRDSGVSLSSMESNQNYSISGYISMADLENIMNNQTYQIFEVSQPFSTVQEVENSLEYPREINGIPEEFQVENPGDFGPIEIVSQSEIKTPPPESFHCDSCAIFFPDLPSIQHHIRTVHDSKTSKFQCHLCFKNYASRRTLNYHLVRHTELGAANSFDCKFCSKKFSSTGYLQQHLSAQHLNNYTLKCEKCGKKFQTEKSLKLHATKHSSDQKAWRCEICPRSYVHSIDLRRHVNAKHCAVKPYSCPLCNKGFVRRDHMVKHHEKIHVPKFFRNI
jgi:hypothetical protein